MLVYPVYWWSFPGLLKAGSTGCSLAVGPSSVLLTQADEDFPRGHFDKAQRLEQLLEVSRQVIAEEGTDALSLGRLAEAAGITKLTVYDHFGTREGLLTDLYRDFEVRRNLLIDGAMAAGETTLEFLGKCRAVLGPFAGELSTAGLWGMLGAADALSGAAVAGEIGHEQARGELFEVIVSLVSRSH